MADRRHGWRPGPDTAIAIAALVLAGGGVSWAVTQGSSVITSCVDANNVMHLSTDGTCPVGSGETTVQWNQLGLTGPTGIQGARGLVGSQGPPGRPGVSAAQPVFAFGHQVFSFRFAIDMDFTAPGTYDVEGTVTEDVNTATWSHVFDKYKGLGLTCLLYAGANGWLRRDVETTSFTFYGGSINKFYPTFIDGPAGAGAIVNVPGLPYHARFQCEGTLTHNGRIVKVVNLPAKWIDPSITAEIAKIQHVSPSKLVVVGPVLKIGPGPGPVQTR
jgi:hypothetical protein